MKFVPLLTATSLALAALPASAQTAAIDSSALREEAKGVFEAIPANLSAIKQTDEDPQGVALTPEKIELGKVLFFDPRMSRSGLISCQTCHNVGLGGVDGLPTSVGHGWQKGPRNAPTMLNAIFNAAQFWDGRAPDLAEQAKGPVQASVEMSNTPDELVKTINSMPEYVTAFQNAFPGENDPVSFDNFAAAIEQFEATLITPNSPFDRFLAGDDAAMDEAQKRGLQAFMETGCTACHYGINLGGQDYYPFGLVAKPGAEVLPVGDTGRFEVTKTVDDEYVFRAAPLRNVALTAPYFHSGVVWDLKEAVQIMSSSQLGTELNPQQVDDIVAFLSAVTGEQPQIVHPILPVRTDATPLPAPM
ncbi:cytochrome c peroxidase [Paracoccus aminovorans]|uniref:Cytochrome c peroxidase n=1 Tax=Paracoccus aminovorans TaxID=34004 RepID=A0A1I3BP10_9RHOB|nr:cytochrome-c peroxidase [Paracoccus aminovorans]CQR86850.1 cytochrome c peroxidase [Paracoccus aminovorans]SFH63521.1 cytochrome c peroxidase [Paracoccus aminovorans]